MPSMRAAEKASRGPSRRSASPASISTLPGSASKNSTNVSPFTSKARSPPRSGPEMKAKNNSMRNSYPKEKGREPLFPSYPLESSEQSEHGLQELLPAPPWSPASKASMDYRNPTSPTPLQFHHVIPGPVSALAEAPSPPKTHVIPCSTRNPAPPGA